MTKRRRRKLPMMNNTDGSKKKKEKKELRAKSAKRWKIFRGVNRLFWFVVVGVILVLGGMTYKIWDKYNDTLDWEKNDSSIQMASQSLDMLYDKDPKSKKSKLEFADLRKTMIDDDGQLTDEATKSNINKLKKYLKDINTDSSEVDYKKEYAEIALKYSLNQQYDDLFEDDSKTILKESVTPLSLSELNDQIFDDLKTLYKMNKDDKFVEAYINKEKRLVKDVTSFNSLVTLFNEAVIIDKNTLTLKEGYTDNLKESFDTIYSNLSYDWTSTSFMTTVVSMLKPINDEVIKDHEAYQAYITDIGNKEVAYSEWEQTKTDFFAAVQAIHEQAVAEKRAREAEEQRLNELAQLVKDKIEELKKFTNLPEVEYDKYIQRLEAAETKEEVYEIFSQASARDTQIENEKNNPPKEANGTGTSSSDSTDNSTGNSTYNGTGTSTGNSQETQPSDSSDESDEPKATSPSTEQGTSSSSSSN